MIRKSAIFTVLFWLLVLFTGVAFGAGLYEARVQLPQWLTTVNGIDVWHADIAKASDPGLNFWAFVTTGPITLLTLLSLIMVWKTKGAVRRWWFTTLAFLLVDRAMTFGYFIPTMVELMSDNMAQAEAVKTAQQWANLNMIRLVASGASFLAAIKLLIEYSNQSAVVPTSKKTQER